VSNPDKHKPLSAEELFKLLDNQSGRETDFENMDDFEKDALEGFTKHSTIQKAKTLTEELNLSISKRVEETGNGGPKNRIIWFSAAASLACIILISIFVFNRSKQNLETNIALNETKEDKKIAPFAEDITPLETETSGISNSVKEQDISAQVQTKSQESTIIKNAEGESAAGVKQQAPITLEENKPEIGYEKAAKDEAKSRNENDDVSQKQVDALAVKIDSKKKEKSSSDQEEVNSELSVNENITTSTAFNTKKEDYKADQDKTEVSKNLEKEKSTRETVASDKANVSSGNYAKYSSAPSSASVADNKTSGAYYTGSELAIRKYVLSYLKSKQSVITIAGTYKISGSVSAEGKLKINSITQTTKVNCNCEGIITEALNTMTEWNPALQNEKLVQSKVEFTIQF
jgi:hypothetical protein